MSQTERYDVIVSGGGVAGCLTAFAILQNTDLNVLLLEANPQVENNNKHAGFDARVIALAAESLSKLSEIGVEVNNIPTSLIKNIHVSDRHHLGQVRLSCEDYRVSELGRVVSIDALGMYLLSLLSSFAKDRFQYYCPAKAVSVVQHNSHVTLELSNSKIVETKLLVICDGANSSTAKKLNLNSVTKDYGQSAVITNVKTQLPHYSVAYERFTSQGPVAFLPMNDGDAQKHGANSGKTMSVVWCMQNSNVENVMSLQQKEFLTQLNQLFAHKLGNLLSCSQRYSYPLIKQSLTNFTSHRVICLANSAQSLHPIAGQGFNLGIRDVYDLLEVLRNAQDPGVFRVIDKYQTLRQNDKNNTLAFTDSLVSLFSNQYEPLLCSRNLGLVCMNLISPLKRRFANFSMGKRITYK